MTDRTQGILNRASEAEKFSGVRWILGDGVITNYMQSFVDETMKRNAEFQSRAGVSPKIVRKSPTKCCPWCDALVGEYKYPDDVPDDVYRRHDNCNCIVEFYPGDGTKQDVWTKQWDSAEVLEERKKFVGIDTAPKSIVERSEPAQKMVEQAQANNLKHNEVKPLERKLTDDEIIDRLAGGDMTNGSCVSLCHAYTANKACWDVLDFRGGNSQYMFSQNVNVERITQLKGVKFSRVELPNDFKAAKELTDTMETGKDYMLIIGKHGAIVRKTDDGLQYLELQSAKDRGFKPLDGAELKRRFGCTKSHTFMGMKYSPRSYLIDCESLYNNDEYKEILGYINTAADEQKKGTLGTIK